MSKQNGSGIVGTAIAFISKGAKLLKLLKVAKPLVMFISMAISAIAYTFWMGPWLAIIFVGLLLIHEMGHVAAMHIKKLGTPPVVFIPMLGAAMFAPSFGDRDTEAFVGYGGPLVGTVASLILFGIWTMLAPSTIASLLLVGSYLGIVLNLFNLIPISPLDGGRVTQAVGGWFKYVGLFSLAALSIWWRQPVVLYIWILVLFDLTMIPVRLRAILLSAIWVAMATLMSLGYGNQPYWANLIDCAVTALFVARAIYRAFHLEDDVQPDTRPVLNGEQQTKWCVVYIALAGILVGTMLLQSHLMSQLVHK